MRYLLLCLTLTGCASGGQPSAPAYEWRLMAEGHYLHCEVDGPCDDRFVAFKAKAAVENWL